MEQQLAEKFVSLWTGMETEQVAKRPDAWGKQWEAQATHWKITLHHDERQITFYFSQGSGHKGATPKVQDVVSAIVSDADCAYDSFEEFCNNLGYDSDSIKAYKTWEACKEMGQKVRELFGNDFEEIADVARAY